MKKQLKPLVATAMLAALSCVLFFFTVATPLTPSFLKLDLSDLPALLASLALGAPYGVLVSLLKNVVGLLRTSTGGVGELSNFVLSATLSLVAGLAHRRLRGRGGVAASTLLGAAAMAAISFPSNYFLVYPLYTKVLGWPMAAIVGMYSAILPRVHTLWQALLVFNVPFTFVKAAICAALALAVYLPLERTIRNMMR